MRSSPSVRRARRGCRLLLERFEERLCPVLTLTQAGVDAGFSLSIFAMDFPVQVSGPIGIEFPSSGGVLVSDGPGNVRLFPTDTDGQSAAWVQPGQNYGHANALGLAQVDGSIYMTQQFMGRVVQINDDGTFNRMIVGGLPFATGIVANPANGHLFVASQGLSQIADVDPIAQTWTRFANTPSDPNGLAISADGSILYVVAFTAGRAVGYEIGSGNVVFDSGFIAGNPDGVFVGQGPLAGNLYVSTNNGRLVQIDLETRQQTLIASNGSRGNLVTVDPYDGSVLITQLDRIIRLRFPTVEDPVLLYDSYLVSRVNVHENFEVAERQSGRFAPLLYAEGGEPLYSLVNHQDSPDTLWLAGSNFNVSGRVALESNLTVDPGLGRAFVMEFDVNPVLTHRPHFNRNQNTWISINFGTTIEFRNRFPNNTDGVSMLFRGNGRTQGFNNSVNLGEGRFAPGADDDFHHIRIEVFDPADGNPFDGSGPATVRAYADYDGTPFFSFTRPNGFISNYISLISQGEGSEGDGVVRHALTNLLLWFDGCACEGPGPTPGSRREFAVLDRFVGDVLENRRQSFPDVGAMRLDEPVLRRTVPGSAEHLGRAAPAPVEIALLSTGTSRRAVDQLFAVQLSALDEIVLALR